MPNNTAKRRPDAFSWTAIDTVFVKGVAVDVDVGGVFAVVVCVVVIAPVVVVPVTILVVLDVVLDVLLVGPVVTSVPVVMRVVEEAEVDDVDAVAEKVAVSLIFAVVIDVPLIEFVVTLALVVTEAVVTTVLVYTAPVVVDSSTAVPLVNDVLVAILGTTLVRLQT